MIAALLYLALAAVPAPPATVPVVYDPGLDHGKLVIWNACPQPPRLHELRAAIARAYEAAAATESRVEDLTLDGVTVVFTPIFDGPEIGGHVWLGGGVSLVLIDCGRERIMEHELWHRFAHQLSIPCDAGLVRHRPGFDLHCRPLG